jgi:hypothetical protein
MALLTIEQGVKALLALNNAEVGSIIAGNVVLASAAAGVAVEAQRDAIAPISTAITTTGGQTTGWTA